MHTNSERVNLALEKLKEVQQEVKCSEDFVEGYSYPTFNLENIEKLSQRPDFFNILRVFMLNCASRDFLAWLTEKSLSFDRPQSLSVDVASIFHIGYGECGELTNFLILKLIRANKFPIVSRYEIDGVKTVNHAFATIEDESGVEWALDPLFQICCPLNDYYQNEKVVNYFNKHLKISNWNKCYSEIEVTYYPTDIQRMALPFYEQQIQTLCSNPENKKHPSIKAIQKALNITDNNYKDGLDYMKGIFIKDVMKLNNVSEDQATSFVNRHFEKILFSGSSNDNIQEIPSNISNSNTGFFKDSNALVAIKLEKALPRYKNPTFWAVIDSKDYSRALRMVCTMKDQEKSLQLAKILCEFKTQLSIDITQINSQGLSAIDYAKQKGNESLKEFLESQIKEEHILIHENTYN